MNLYAEIQAIKKMLSELLQKESERDKQIQTINERLQKIENRLADLEKCVKGIKSALITGFKGIIKELESLE